MIPRVRHPPPEAHHDNKCGLVEISYKDVLVSFVHEKRESTLEKE